MVRNPPAKVGDIRDTGSVPEWGRSPGEGTPVFLPEESHGQRSLVGYSLLGYKESDMTEETAQTKVNMQSFLTTVILFIANE